MLSWIEGYVKRWAGIVASPVIDLAHWALHALASVVYTVFAHVGSAWHEIYGGIQWIHRWADQYLGEVGTWIGHIVHHDLPVLWAWIKANVAADIALARNLYNKAIAAAVNLYHLAVHAIAALQAWTEVHVLDPLEKRADQIWADLLKWGFVAWDYITHPDKLAPVILGPLISFAEKSFWTVAAPVGRFAIGIVLHNAAKFATLIEDIFNAVI